MVNIEFNEAALQSILDGVTAKAEATNGNFPIPRDSTVEQIEEIITAQLVAGGVTPNPEGVKEKAQEMFDAMRDGEI